VLWTGVEGGEQGDKKEVIIKGQVGCAKCSLDKEKTCMTVVVEKKDGKDIVYYFVPDSHAKFPLEDCSVMRAGSVTGTVASEKDGKQVITVKEVKYEK
jgi:hypothetical protein